MEYVKENNLENEENKRIGYLMDNKEKYTKSKIMDNLIIEVLKEVIFYDDVEYY